MKLSLHSWLPGKPVPAEVLDQAGAANGRVIWSADLAQWAPAYNRDAILTLAEAALPDGATRDLAFFTRGKTLTVLGALLPLFPGAPVTALALDCGGERVIVGRVDGAVTGSLTHVDLERVEPDTARWMEAVRSSTLHERVFLIPIKAGEREAWNRIARLTIDTRESLERGWQRRGAHTANAVVFEPPLDLSAAWFNLP